MEPASLGDMSKRGTSPLAGFSDVTCETDIGSVRCKRTMTIAELADYFETSPVEVRRLFRSRRKAGFPRFKNGNKWCANLEDVQDWLLAMVDGLDE